MAIRSSLYSREIVNTLHVKSDPSGAASDRGVQDVTDDVWSWLGTAYKAVLATEGTVLDVTAREEPQATVKEIPDTYIRPVNEAGTLSTPNNLPVELTMHLKVKTGAAVRSGHGGMFLPPPLSSTFLNGDGLSFNGTSAYWTAAQALVDALLAGHDWTTLTDTGGHHSMVIYSRTRRAQGKSNYFFDVNNIILNPIPTWLRSRRS